MAAIGRERQTSRKSGVSETEPSVEVGRIERRILLIRGEKVIIDANLAAFYGVPTKRINEQVKRNRRRFPRDFVFSLTAAEKSELVAKCDHLSKLKYSKALMPLSRATSATPLPLSIHASSSAPCHAQRSVSDSESRWPTNCVAQTWRPTNQPGGSAPCHQKA
jgi:hypothetical protein